MADMTPDEIEALLARAEGEGFRVFGGAEYRAFVAALRAQAATIAELRQSEQAAWDMIEGWNDMEQERDEAQNASKHYAGECERHLATIAELTRALADLIGAADCAAWAANVGTMDDAIGRARAALAATGSASEGERT